MERIKDFFHYFLIPSDRNNFRAKVLHHDFLTYYLVFAFIFVFFVKSFGVPSNILGFATDITTMKLLEETNKERAKNNLPPLSYNERLSQAALRKAQDMFTRNYWSHYGPDGKTPWDFILSSEYQYEYAGENLAKNFLFSQNVVDAWMASQTHRENLLRRDFTEVGFAIQNGVLNGEETTLVVQMFGKPTTATVAENSPQLARNTETQGVVVAKNNPETILSGNKNEKLAVRGLTARIVYAFVAFLTIVLALDLFVAAKLNVIRIHGKNLAHLLFLITLLAGVALFVSKGAIL